VRCAAPITRSCDIALLILMSGLHEKSGLFSMVAPAQWTILQNGAMSMNTG